MLREHERQMIRAIEDRIPRAGTGMRVRGRYPVFIFSGTEEEAQESTVNAEPYQLQMSEDNGVIRFTRGRVQAGAYIVIPTIGGFSVDSPSASLPLLSGGGQVFAKYTYTLNLATVPYDWNDVFVSCELVQVALNDAPPETVFVTIGTAGGVSAAEGEAYTLLMTYAAGGDIIHYGQSSILPPDPDDDFPTESVIFVAPQVSHVA